MRNVKIFTFLTVVLSLFVSCRGIPGIRRITIFPASAEVAIGETVRIDFAVEPETAPTHYLFWECSDPTVAELKDYYLFCDVTGLSEGTCTVTATLGRKKASCQITVYKIPKPAKAIYLSESVLDLKKTDTRQLRATISPLDADVQIISWKSENPSVATVDETGLVTAVSEGSTVVTAQCGEVSATCEVSVWERSGITVECVDLGLSVDWCTTDLGAGHPEGLGDYYAWGEVKGKTFFDWSNYRFYDETYRELTKYCSDSHLGYCDNRFLLEPTDDAAYRLVGDEYRIPTSAQWAELLEFCTWEEYRMDGVKGYKVTNKSHPERWIFLPFGDSVSGVLPSSIPVYRGVYWTASKVDLTGMSRYAWTVTFSSSRIDRLEAERCDGARIRPVRLK